MPPAGRQVGLDLLHFLPDSVSAALTPGPVAFRTMMMVPFLLQRRAPTLSRLEAVRTNNSFQQVLTGPSSGYGFHLAFAILAHVGSFQLDLLFPTTLFLPNCPPLQTLCSGIRCEDNRAIEKVLKCSLNHIRSHSCKQFLYIHSASLINSDWYRPCN